MQREKKSRNVIAISASPSRGRNSDTMLDAFLRGVRKVEEIEVEKIYLDDVPIDYYKYENKDGPASHEVEFKELADKIQNTEGLVISSPTYNYSVPAHLKNFIDRLRFFALDFGRKTMLGQPVGMMEGTSTFFLVSGGTPNWAERVMFFAFPLFWLRGVFIYYGSSYVGGIYSGDTKTYENKKVLAKCEREGHKFAYKLMRGECRSFLERLFWRPPQAD
jgi:FMN-dependent NADH-azoreductase